MIIHSWDQEPGKVTGTGWVQETVDWGAGGAAAGALSDVGLNNDFMKELAKTMQPDSPVLYVLVRKAAPDKVLAELQGSGGKILRTSLSHGSEARLLAAPDAARQEV